MALEVVRHTIIVPGLGDNTTAVSRPHNQAAERWQAEGGFSTEVFYPNWHTGKLSDKSDALVGRMEAVLAEKNELLLVGTSGGSALALLGRIRFPNARIRMVAIGGRLNTLSPAGYPSLAQVRQLSPALADAVETLAQEGSSSLTSEMRSDVMTLRIEGDERIHPDVSVLDGADNRTFTHSAEGNQHQSGIGAVLRHPTPNPVVVFLNSG